MRVPSVLMHVPKFQFSIKLQMRPWSACVSAQTDTLNCNCTKVIMEDSCDMSATSTFEKFASCLTDVISD